MNQRTLTEIVQLSNAANRLLQSVRDHTPAEHLALIHKNSMGVLTHISALLDSEASTKAAAPVAQAVAAQSEGASVPAGAVVLTWDQLMNANTGLLGLPTRLEASLRKSGIVTIQHICSASPESIRSIESVGTPGLQKIIASLAPFGVTMTD
ncbi:hypothetical protein GOD54_23435 [Sinorhizobium medicae]|nr:hypothetical protein [Sinorhizobium medicae]